MVSISRRTIVVAGIGLVLVSGLSGASLLYVTSRDNLALTFLERQAKLKRGYEEQIQALRAQADHASDQQNAEQKSFEERLHSLLARQDAFEARQAVVQNFAEQVGMSSAGLSAPGPASSVEVTSPTSAAHAYAPEPKPKLETDDIFQLRLRRPEGTKPDKTSRLGPVESLKLAESKLHRFERNQMKLLEAVIQSAEAEAMHLHTAISRTGIQLSALDSAPDRAGGPLIPAAGATEAFRMLVAQAQTSIGRLVMLRRSMAALPFGEPIDGEIDFSSGFGYRMDPFTRSPALHTGLDFRAEFGASVRAAGAGRVVTAEYSGAYGNMVEIDHGNGVTSRYAHLSAITVDPGQTVQMGTRIGHVGSTGRSTGPHLHYETRISGEPVNPHRFLKAGFQFAPVTTASR